MSDTFGQWLLPYDAVRKAADPDAAVLAFLRPPTRGYRSFGLGAGPGVRNRYSGDA